VLCVPFSYIESKLKPWNVHSYLVIAENIWILKLTLSLMLFVLGDTIIVHGLGLVLLVSCSWCCTISSVVDAFDCVSQCNGHDAYLPFPLPLLLPNLALAKFYDKRP
jgi:hypothetical protein